LNCGKTCLNRVSFREDDISRAENDCLSNCFHKNYRYLAYANTLFSYLVSENGKIDGHIENQKELTPNEML